MFLGSHELFLFNSICSIIFEVHTRTNSLKVCDHGALKSREISCDETVLSLDMQLSPIMTSIIVMLLG